MNYYTPLYRPPDSFTVPPGFVMVEAPQGFGFERSPFPRSKRYKYGVIAYAKPLSEADVRRYQLEYADPEPGSIKNPGRSSMSTRAAKLDDFTRQYIETALWSENDEDGTPLDKNYDISDISEATLKSMIEDCRDFQEKNQDDIASDPGRAGHDFWLTRNHHGAGFWDGDWPKAVGERLTKAAHAYGEVNLYVGDDGLIYAM